MLADVGLGHGGLDGPGKPFFIQVMTLDHARARIGRQRGRGKDPEPPPALPQLRILGLKRMRHLDTRTARCPVLFPQLPSHGNLPPQRRSERLGQHDHPILVALGLAHDDHIAIELHVLDTQPNRLHQTHAGAVQQPCDECRRVDHRLQQDPDLLTGQHSWNATRIAGSLQVGHPGKLGTKHLFVEEQEGTERLVVRGG